MDGIAKLSNLWMLLSDVLNHLSLTLKNTGCFSQTCIMTLCIFATTEVQPISVKIFILVFNWVKYSLMDAPILTLLLYCLAQCGQQTGAVAMVPVSWVCVLNMGSGSPGAAGRNLRMLGGNSAPGWFFSMWAFLLLALLYTCIRISQSGHHTESWFEVWSRGLNVSY